MLVRAKERSSAVHIENYSIRVRSEHTENTIWSEQHKDYRPKVVESPSKVNNDFEVLKNRKFVQTLNSKDAIRLQNLIDVTNKQLLKPNVTTATLKRVLNHKQFTEWKSSLVEFKENSEILYGSGCSDELRKYSQKVARADFLHGKADRMSAKREFKGYKYQFSTIEKAYSAAESAYEDAIESLQELWSVKTPQELFEIECWLDRPVSWTIENYPSIDPHGIPRVRGSKSPYVEAYLPKLHKKLKREHCILDALISAIDEIVYIYEEEIIADEVLIAQKNKLKNLLNKLKR